MVPRTAVRLKYGSLLGGVNISTYTSYHSPQATFTVGKRSAGFITEWYFISQYTDPGLPESGNGSGSKPSEEQQRSIITRWDITKNQEKADVKTRKPNTVPSWFPSEGDTTNPLNQDKIPQKHKH